MHVDVGIKRLRGYMDDRKTVAASLLRVEELRMIADELFNWSGHETVQEFLAASVRRLHLHEDG